MIDTYGRTKLLHRVVGAAMLLFTLSSNTEANPLDVVLDPYPVILAGFLNASYTVSTGSLVINGKTKTIDKGTGQTSFSNPFQVRATISSAGIASGGQMTIGTGGTLLSSLNLLQFGYDPLSGGAIEFLFGSPSGSLVMDSTFPDKPVDVIFRGLTFPGSWAADWTSTSFSAMAEIRSDPPVGTPEPATLLLMLTGAGGALVRRYRRRPSAV
jgi:hypothetical protein